MRLLSLFCLIFVVFFVLDVFAGEDQKGEDPKPKEGDDGEKGSRSISGFFKNAGKAFKPITNIFKSKEKSESGDKGGRSIPYKYRKNSQQETKTKASKEESKTKASKEDTKTKASKEEKKTKV